MASKSNWNYLTNNYKIYVKPAKSFILVRFFFGHLVAAETAINTPVTNYHIDSEHLVAYSFLFKCVTDTEQHKHPFGVQLVVTHSAFSSVFDPYQIRLFSC